MQYLLIHAVDEELAAEQPLDEAARSRLEAWIDECVSSRVNLHGSRLALPSDATTVRVRSDERLLTDGPFAETKEQVAGYDLLECSTEDEALEWASRHPTAELGAVEVRPLVGAQAPAGLPPCAPKRRRYVMFVCTAPADGGEREAPGPVEPWVEEMDRRGIRLFGSELAPSRLARTVRVREGHAVITDGPFAETKEQIAGFDVLECADLDEAIEVASSHPMARGGLLELRPVWPIGER